MLTPPATAMHPPINLIPAHRQDQASRFVDVEILESRQVIKIAIVAGDGEFQSPAGLRNWRHCWRHRLWKQGWSSRIWRLPRLCQRIRNKLHHGLNGLTHSQFGLRSRCMQLLILASRTSERHRVAQDLSKDDLPSSTSTSTCRDITNFASSKPTKSSGVSTYLCSIEIAMRIGWSGYQIYQVWKKVIGTAPNPFSYRTHLQISGPDFPGGASKYHLDLPPKHGTKNTQIIPNLSVLSFGRKQHPVWSAEKWTCGN